ncbi:MAG TPA: sugar phosphate isomerase/epimerase [Roseiarcus sp.]|nr:sugar phosphate isomerase/epimerase [Roseiarcus sp.]
MTAKTYQISFQLYTARNFPSQEVVLRELKSIGYDAVEAWTGNFEDAKGFRARIDAVGLRCLSFHAPFRGLVEQTHRFIDIAHTLGASLIVAPYLAPEDRPVNAAGWRAVGEKLVQVAERAARDQLKVAWHNHDFEYLPLADGSRPIDIMLEAAGPEVGFEIDLAWVKRAQADPVVEVTRYAPRIFAIHVKDTAPAGASEEGGWRAAGAGILDWKALWPSFASTAAGQLVVEHDEPKNWLQVAQDSYDFLVAMGARG